MPVKDYIRQRFFPHIWCPGCGHGIVLGGFIRAIEKLQLDKNEIVLVSGIGCSSRITGYLDFHTMHTLHGRALAFASGVKMSRPELNLIAMMGDGDALSIGGNHFIHSARRNIDITALIMNNNIYGMTGGQFSPLTPTGSYATTAPYTNIDRAFDAVELAMAAGATFVARTTAYHVHQLTDIIAQAISHKGFSAVEILSPCPTYFGRKNKMKSPVQMLEHLRDTTTRVGSGKKQQDPRLIETGVFIKKDEPEYCSQYDMIIERAKNAARD